MRTDESGRFCPECGAALIEQAARQVEAAAPSGSSSSATKLIGLTIDGQFEIEAIIGGGAFGTVYRGRQVGLDRPVAVKVPTFEIAADPVMAKRFAREARAAARVQHPGVVGIFAVGELADGRPYLAMQLVDGEPLDRALSDGPLPPARALRIARAIASALSETHAADVVHRDLKPTNVMWRRDRSGDDRITLVDFGIAVAKPGNAEATRLTANGLIGTPHYMSPEQAHGEIVDARADLYALGCLLFELVTGTTPFEGSGFEVLLAHLGRPAPLPSSKNPDVPECIDELCAALMQKKPDDRPANADTVVALIDEALEQLPDAMRVSQENPRAAASSSARKSRKPARTLATRHDLPEGTVTPSRRRRVTRHILSSLVAVAALGGAGFAVNQLRDHPNAGIEPAADEGSAADNDPRIGRRRTITKDNGDVIATAAIPDPLLHGFESRARLDLKNKLGQPLVAEEVVLTIADSSGAAKGLTARPRGAADKRVPGRYYFSYSFPQKGHYVVRVFTPASDSTLEIPLDVE
ncbi:MAG TPA: serine/threonine-protein kinase [Kofleriaceae bacterium]|nr:serine/threonine-protein kinase [Kofleriaceae bacterium]